MNIKKFIFFGILLLTITYSCEKDKEIKIENQSSSFTGITETDEHGVIIFNDETDWNLDDSGAIWKSHYLQRVMTTYAIQ